MWTKIILLVLTALEISFLVWNVKDKRTHLRWKGAARLVLAMMITILMLVGVLQGFSRYAGIILLLTVMGILSVISLRRKGEREAKVVHQVFRAVGSGLLYTAAMLPAILFPQYKAIVPTGGHAVETALYTWTDESRVETYTDTGEKRRVTVKMYYPEEAGQYPLAVFSHGAASMIESNDSTCCELASHGYVVAAVAHPYHAIFVEDTDGNVTPIDTEFMRLAFGGTVGLSSQDWLAIYRDWMSVRTGDMNFVLDTLLAKAAKGEEGAFERIDPEHIGLFGHSLGGATCEAVGRQREDIDAVIVLEGTMLGDYVDCDGDRLLFQTEPYPLPLLDVNSDSLLENVSKDYQNRDEYINFYVVKNAVDAREVTLRDAAHMNFCDLPLVSPPLAGMFGTGKRDPRECIQTVNQMVLDYFDYYLKDSGKLTVADEY